MSKIVRKLQKIFAGGATNNGQFGSAQVGTKILSNDLDTLQALTAFADGWTSATLSSENLPALEEMQALHFMTTSQIAYLFQEGIPEYGSTTEYHTNSIVKKAGGYELYGSLINTNVGNALPAKVDDANWKYLGDLAELKIKQQPATGTIHEFAGSEASLPAGYLLAYGQEVSRSTYSDLFAVVGTNFGVGDGATTFNLPDKRGRTGVGRDNMGGTSANTILDAQADVLGGQFGVETGVGGATSLSIAQLANHNHYTVDSNSTGTNQYTSYYSDNGATSNGNLTYTSSTGSNQSHTHAENRVQPSMAMNYIIKT